VDGEPSYKETTPQRLTFDMADDTGKIEINLWNDIAEALKDIIKDEMIICLGPVQLNIDTEKHSCDDRYVLAPPFNYPRKDFMFKIGKYHIIIEDHYNKPL
jgi:hypothetical protein